MPVDYKHISVLNNEVIELLQAQPGHHYIDCTLGGGGHAKAILEKSGPDGMLLAFEADQRAIKAARNNLEKYKDRLIVVNKSYVHLKEEFDKYKKRLPKISGILFDLGLSSDQLDKANRGFSFKDTGPLDMRFDPDEQKLTASEIILTWPEDKLVKIFREYGEIKQAKKIAKGIINWRQAPLAKQKQKMLETPMFVSAILRILNIKESNLKRYRIHPATKIFQSLRIAVNDELENIKKTLPQALSILSSGGRLAVISFHSLEDRIVKRYFNDLARDCICPPNVPVCVCNNKAKIKIINKRGIKPSEKEILMNPRSRSAILRVIEQK